MVVTLDADHHLVYRWAAADPSWPDDDCVVAVMEAYLIDLETPRTRRAG